MNKIIKIIFLTLTMSLSLITNAKTITEFEKELSTLNFEEQKKIFNEYMNNGSNKSYSYPFLGYMYYNGIGVSKNIKAAVNIFQRTVDEGSNLGFYLLGKHYIETGEDINKGLDYLITASDSNLIEATMFIGKIYKEGIGVNQDDYYSTEYYYKAAKGGSNEAKFIISQDLLKSIEATKIKKGLELLTEAAEGKNLSACRQLKDLYLSKNNIVSQDTKKHFKYLLCMANNEDLESIQKVAEYYSKGFIVMINNKLAYENYSKYVKLVKSPTTVEEKDNYYKASISYIKFKKYTEAAKLLKLISEQGYSEASNVLGRLYESNYLDNPNINESLKYYKLARDQGFENENDIIRLEKILENINKTK